MQDKLSDKPSIYPCFLLRKLIYKCWLFSASMSTFTRGISPIFNGHSRILNRRYLPYIRPIFQAYIRHHFLSSPLRLTLCGVLVQTPLTYHSPAPFTCIDGVSIFRHTYESNHVGYNIWTIHMGYSMGQTNTPKYCIKYSMMLVSISLIIYYIYSSQYVVCNMI